jgi:hypothetical protein
MTWEQLQKFLKAKVFLIGLTFIDQDEKIIEQYQTSGTLFELSDSGLLRFTRRDGSIFQMPYDKDTIKKAVAGEYREKSTGDIIVNPDYITTWEIKVKHSEDISEIKQRGYI